MNNTDAEAEAIEQKDPVVIDPKSDINDFLSIFHDLLMEQQECC